MGSTPSNRLLAMFLVLAVGGAAFVLIPQKAAADASAPRWTGGDFWLYADASNRNNTLRVEVVGRESTRTLLGSTYETFHIRETLTTGSIGITTNSWVRESDLGLVNSTVTLFNIVTITTYEPPQTQARFPLTAQKTWNVALNVSIKIGGGQVNTFSLTVSAQVEGESDVVVPAGTFHSFSIRGTGGGPYTKFYFSDQVGYWSKRESYDAQDQKTGEMVLTDYRYQWNTTFLLIIVGAVLTAAIAIAAFVTLRRRRRQAPPGSSPPMPPAPPSP